MLQTSLKPSMIQLIDIANKLDLGWLGYGLGLRRPPIIIN